jgi:large subunit ribosomal protein L22
MQVKARLSQLRIAPRKVRLVADSIRGLDVEIAQAQLTNLNKKSALPVLKLLNSAIANAENNFKLKKDNLYISEIRVDEGVTLKRWVPRAMGSASRINKRTSHINIILSEKVESKEVKKEKSEKVEKKDKDVKIVQNLEELKEIEKTGDEKNKNKQENMENKISKDTQKNTKKNIFRRKSI